MAPTVASSPQYAEVDQWTRVATTSAATLASAALAVRDATLPLGAGLGYALGQVSR